MLKGKRQVVYVMLITTIFFYSCEKEVSSVVRDIDGNEYKTITIGEQVWMAENLKVSHYRNGDPIPNMKSSGDWQNTKVGAYCYYDNKSSYGDTYGALYNWIAVDDSRKLAPEGWHIPTDDEWKELELYLGMSESDVNQEDDRGFSVDVKLAGNSDLWPVYSLNDQSDFGQSGFNALPGGSRDGQYGEYGSIGIDGAAGFWTGSGDKKQGAWYRSIFCFFTGVNRRIAYRLDGLSVRCVKD
jgi:uncharacterized protein (TIGR02145 family)